MTTGECGNFSSACEWKHHACVATVPLARLLSARIAAIGSALFLSGCDGGVLDPQGPIGAAERTILLDALAIMLAIIVPTIVATLCIRVVVPRSQHEGALSSRMGLFRTARAGGLVHSASDDHVSRRYHLDRFARARSAAPPQRTASRSMFRSSRSTGNGCSSTPSSGSRPSTSSLFRPERRCTSR